MARRAKVARLTGVVHRQEFASFGDLLAAANGSCSLPDSERHSRTASHEFTSTHDYAESCSLAVNGVPEVEARISRLSDTLESLSADCTTLTRYEYDVCGDDVDVSRFLSGEPENMVRYVTETRTGGNILSIVVNGGAGFLRSTQSIERRGAAVLALVDLLESAGYRVELTVLFANASASTGETCCTRVNVKQSHEALDLTRLAYSLAHASMLRRTMFSYWETLSHLRARFGFCNSGNYGYIVEDEPDSCDVYVSTDDFHHFSTDDSARNWIRHTIQELGVETDA